MKDHVILSFTAISGSRHFEIRKTALQAAGALLALMIVSIPLLLSVAGYLQGDRRSLARSVDRLQSEKQMFLYETKQLQAEFGRIQKALDSMGSFTNAESVEPLPPSRRVLQAVTYMADREQEFLMLEDRIGHIESILGEARVDGESLKKRVAAAGLNAELKKAVLDSIPNGCPVPMRGVTSGFGPRIHPITGKKEFHKGLDLRAPMRTPVIVPADGVVEFAGPHRKSGLGNLLVVRHNFGFSTCYGHLDKILVKTGTVVHKGQKVALTGNSGLSNGPHLHYDIQYIYRHLNPKPFIAWDIDSWDSVFSKVKKVDWDSILGLIQLRYPPREKNSFQLANFREFS